MLGVVDVDDGCDDDEDERERVFADDEEKDEGSERVASTKPPSVDGVSNTSLSGIKLPMSAD